jgi:hypothetical protein
MDDTIGLDFGHLARNQIAGKWQGNESSIEGLVETMECRVVGVSTRLHSISVQRRFALA